MCHLQRQEQAGQGGSGESLRTNNEQQPGKYRAYPDFLLDWLEFGNLEIGNLLIDLGMLFKS